MKRNLFPLLGIAFVVAIAATGVFYGLFVGKIRGAAPETAVGSRLAVVSAKSLDRGAVVTAADVRLEPSKAPADAYTKVEDVVGRTVVKAIAGKEPLTPGNLAASGGRLNIPKGMRAISIRAADSSGLLPFVRAGQRIDVQWVHSQHGGETVARTLLSNVEVINVHPDPSNAPVAVTILNLLVEARDVEKVALADSAAKVRIVLRNADDREQTAAPVRALARRTDGFDVAFQVHLAVAPAEGLRVDPARSLTARESALRFSVAPAEWKTAVGGRVLATGGTGTVYGREVSLQPGGERAGGSVRLSLLPRGMRNGKLQLRLRPEYSISIRGGVSSRRFTEDVEVAEGQSVLVAGFERDAATPSLLDHLFPPAGGIPASELLVVVTPRLLGAPR